MGAHVHEPERRLHRRGPSAAPRRYLDADSWVAALQSSMGDLETAAQEAERTGELCEVSND